MEQEPDEWDEEWSNGFWQDMSYIEQSDGIGCNPLETNASEENEDVVDTPTFDRCSEIMHDTVTHNQSEEVPCQVTVDLDGGYL